MGARSLALFLFSRYFLFGVLFCRILALLLLLSPLLLSRSSSSLPDINTTLQLMDLSVPTGGRAALARKLDK
jgi:hypothetical protein